MNSIVNHNKKVIMLLLYLAWFLGSIDPNLINYAIILISKDLNLDASAKGIILSSFSAGFTIMQFPGGWLADRFRVKRLLVSIIIIWSIFTGMTAVAWSLASLVVIRLLFGLSEAPLSPAEGKIIATVFPENERSKTLSIMQSSTFLSTLIAPLLSVVILTTIGWRMLFVIFGVLGIILAISFKLFFKYEDAKPVSEASEQAETKVSIKDIFRNRMIWHLSVGSFCVACVNMALNTWMPTYLSDVRGLKVMSLGWILTIPAIASIVAVLLSGLIQDKISERHFRLFAAVSAFLMAIFVYLMFNASSVTSVIVYQSLVAINIAFLGLLPPTIVLKKMPKTLMGSSLGIIYTFRQAAGFVAPLVVGFAVKSFNGSYGAACIFLIIIAIVSSITYATMKFTTITDLIPTSTQEH